MFHSFGEKELKRSILLIDEQNKKKDRIINSIKNSHIVYEALIGSSCALLCDYCFIPSSSDIDLYALSKNEQDNTFDITIHPFIHPTYKDRILIVDGIKCLSKIDLIVNMFSAHLKHKPTNLIYLTKLMQGEDVTAIKNMIVETIEYAANIYSKEKLLVIKDALRLFDSVYSLENLKRIQEYDKLVFLTWKL